MSYLKVLRRRDVIASAFATAAVSSLRTAPVFARNAPQAGPASSAGSIDVYEVGDNREGMTLHRVRRPAPVPGPGQVRLKVHATGLNARDLTLLRGVHIFGSTAAPPTRVPLDDNACEVLENGPGSSSFKVGERVMATHFPLWIDGQWDDATMSTFDFSVNTDGFLAEQVVVPEQSLVRIPPGLSDEAASTLPNAGLTAWHAVVVGGKVTPGETVLTLGTGGVSMFGMQWAKLMGARVIVTSSSDEKLARVRTLGADLTVNYRTHPDWHQAVLEQTQGRGVDVVLNTVGISELERCLLACASNGRVMLIGSNSVQHGGSEPVFPGLKAFPRGMIMKGLRIQGVIVGSRRMLEDLVAAVSTSHLQPVIDRVFPFDRALEAVHYMETGAKVGKIVIRVG